MTLLMFLALLTFAVAVVAILTQNPPHGGGRV